MGAKGDFTVKVSNKGVVTAAAEPIRHHWVPQSNLDRLLPPVEVGVFLCYKIPSSSFPCGSVMSFLKNALARALVSYHVLAGEIVANPGEELRVFCNNRGVDFVEAFADVELTNLNFYKPEESIEGKLVPKIRHGVLSVQVTELKNGGVVVACAFDHRVADAYSANMFLVSWAELARRELATPSLPPVFRRSFLSPRHPGHYDPSLDDMYMLLSALPPPKLTKQYNADENKLISRVYCVEADQLASLQSQANSSRTIHDRRRTKLEAFSALLWKIVAEGEAESDKVCRMGIVVDGRMRLNEGDEDKAKMMAAYFGNVLSIPSGQKRASALKEMPLSSVADAVHELLEGAATRDHFLDLIDWIEDRRPEQAFAKIYGSGTKEEDGAALVVSSGLRFPVGEVDFGWGRPVFGCFHCPWGGEVGHVMPMPSALRNGDWIVYMRMFIAQLDLIDARAGHIFKPFASNFL
ncbi:Alcohol O-acetyltransferase [Bertholletia excelsa]